LSANVITAVLGLGTAAVNKTECNLGSTHISLVETTRLCSKKAHYKLMFSYDRGHKVGKLAALFVPHSGSLESKYLAFNARKLLQ